jgi:hypothetical protein
LPLDVAQTFDREFSGEPPEKFEKGFPLFSCTHVYIYKYIKKKKYINLNI